MLTRIITGVVALAVFVPVLFLSHTLIFDIAIALISLIGTFELLGCVGVVKKYAVSVPSAVFSAVVPLMFRYVKFEFVFAAFVLYLFCLLYAALFFRKNISTTDAAAAFFSAVLVCLSFTSIIAVRNLENGGFWYLLIFIGAWITDTFAYFTGRIIGKHKLAPVVSPKKTIEGSIGGVIFCVAAFIIYGYTAGRTDYITLAALGIAVSVISQLGDLSMSAVKRNYGVKDFGSIFPGHGGILDRFDSVMAAAPAMMVVGIFISEFA